MIRIFTGAKLRHSLSVNQAPQLIISAISTIVQFCELALLARPPFKRHDLRRHGVGSFGRRASRAYKAALGLTASRGRKRLKTLARRSLFAATFAATHGPNLAAHIDQVKAVPRQLAERFGIAGYDRRMHAKPRIRDLVAILLIEMPHRISNRSVAMRCA
jgi:hypothetical protein